MNKKITFIAFPVIAALIVLFSCTKEVAKLQGPNDAQLYAMAKDSAGRYYYQGNSAAFLPPLGGSPHGTFKLRFNTVAKNALDGSGKLPAGNIFPDSSLIVKVGYTAPNGSITIYAVMFKLNGSWFRAEYSPSGTPYISVSGDISSCISCHNGPNNRDQVLTFFYH